MFVFPPIMMVVFSLSVFYFSLLSFSFFLSPVLSAPACLPACLLCRNIFVAERSVVGYSRSIMFGGALFV